MTGLDIAQVRPLIESEIDRLIGILDLLEPDPDFEEGADLEEDTADDEPLLGAPNQSAGSWKGIDASFGCDDGEELELGWTDLEARSGRYSTAHSDVYEPSLGSNGGINQNNWSKGPTDDREDEFDGREDDADFEPWLGASEPVYNGSYSRNSIKDMIHRHMRPDLYAGIQTVCTGETSQLGWSFHRFSDDREWVDERETFGEGSSCYAGACSPITTMVSR